MLAFTARLSKFWLHQAVKYDFTADLTGHRSLGVNTYVHNSGWVVQAGSTAHKKNCNYLYICMTCSECLLLKFNSRASLYKSKHGMWQEGAGKVMAKMNQMAALKPGSQSTYSNVIYT